MGRPVEDFTVPEALRDELAAIRAELGAGNRWSGEFTELRADGSTFPVLGTATPMYDERDNPIGVVGVSTDLTEHKEAEEALKESEERFSAPSPGSWPSCTVFAPPWLTSWMYRVFSTGLSRP